MIDKEFMATITQSAIACAVYEVVRFCESTRPAHKKAVVKIMEHLLHTKETRTVDCEVGLEVCTDSDFVACLDTRRPASGTVVMLAKGAIIRGCTR